MNHLVGEILQIDDCFTITQTCKLQQQVACLHLCMEGDGLVWLQANRHRCNSGEEVKAGIREYYSNYYNSDRAFNHICQHKKIDTV